MKKKEQFIKEVGYIKNPRYQENANILLDLLPDYFYEVAASSTGKYHPGYAQGEGGLVRHTKVAVRLAYELTVVNKIIGQKFTSDEKDLMIMALLLHDGLKHGEPMNKYVLAEHPLLAAKFIRSHEKDLTLTKNEIEFIATAIESHSGEFNCDYRGNEILPVPVNKYQKFVHLCDLLASKKFLEVPFFDNDIAA